MIRVKKMVPEDVRRVRAIYLECFEGNELKPADFLGLINDKEILCLTAFLNRARAGYLIAAQHNTYFDILHFGVSLKYRRKKVATELIQNLIYRLTDSRTRIRAEVHESNLEAQLFLNKVFGFRAVNTISHSGQSLYLMTYRHHLSLADAS